MALDPLFSQKFIKKWNDNTYCKSGRDDSVMLWPFFLGVEDLMESSHNTHFRVGGVWDLFILRW